MNKELKPEQTEYAVTFLRSLVESREPNRQISLTILE